MLKMKKLNNKLAKYTPFFRAGMKSALAYKAQMYGWIFIGTIEILFIFFLYQAIYRNAPEGMNSVINGFTFQEMILYVATATIFASAISSETSWNIYVEVRDGTIVNTLTKPVSYRLRHLFTCFGQVFFQVIFVALPLLAILYIVFISCGFVHFEPLMFAVNVLFFLCFLLVAILINDALGYMMGMLTFYTQHMFGLNMFMNAIRSFLSGAAVPLSYMGFAGVIFSYLPFAFLSSTPILVLMGKIDIYGALTYLSLALGYILISEIANHFLFNHCIKKIVVQGG